MRLVSASFPLPLPPPPPTPLSVLFTQGYNHRSPYPPTKHPPTQHNNPCILGPLGTTKKYMRFACGGFLPLLLLLLAQTSVGGSGCGAGTVTPSGPLDNSSDILSDAICPLLCLDGSGGGGSDSQQDGTPVRYLYPLSTMMAAPVPALAIGLIALLWVWVLDGAMELRVRTWACGSVGAARNGACRCRVCTLRMQARGQPLHDVGARGASAKMALSGWSSPGYPRQAV
ncbi:hypothetical protein EDB85DRAFT_2154029 [Lactarius pseudohatsudake]|nr:hypothetical protein EDB85DRAFT_2154029 [Lactarius pseudohatsudake]